MLQLSSLKLEALRGATQAFELKFETNRKITIVYGENGSGKSTICDGLDLIGNEVISSLTGKGLSSTTKYWHSTNRTPAEIKVTLSDKTETWTAQVVNSKVVISPSGTRPKIAILRRHQILNLIAARPGDRYAALRPFVAIETIDENEESLRKLINKTRTQVNIVAAQVGENLQTLENVWKQGGASGLSMMAWAELEAQRDTEEISRSIAVIQSYLRQRQALDSRIKDIESSDVRVSSAEEELKNAEYVLNSTLSDAVAGSEDLTQLLRAASSLFQHHERPERCPLCESSELAADLPQRVETRLEALSAVRTALKNKEAAHQARDAAIAQSQTAIRAASLAAEDLCQTCADRWHPDLPSTESIGQAAASRKGLLENDWSREALGRLSTASGALGILIEPELVRRTQRKALLKTVRDALDQYRHNSQQRLELDSLLPRLEKTHQIIVEERRDFIDNILERIATRVGEFYDEVHPGEGLGKVSLQLDPAKRASLDVVSHFPGATDPPPGAYLSESHLDTLGLCIFLALAELEDPGETVLVLDDVVASVDEPHVDRIIEMLYRISQSFAHCILTTHYLPWREKFRWGMLKSGACQFIELGKWSWASGLVLSNTMPRIDRLKSHLEQVSADAADVCATGGVILEAVLDFLTKQYECSIPRKQGKPTLGDLFYGMTTKLRAALRVEMHEAPLPAGETAPTIQLGAIITELQQMMQLRNIMGCHFNEIAFHISGEEGLEFGRRVLKLAEALVDPIYGWPASDKSGEYWTNSGKSRRLYPLKLPK
jgi:energy-coupling factor transporter ATP-binding protein EcfA2